MGDEAQIECREKSDAAAEIKGKGPSLPLSGVCDLITAEFDHSSLDPRCCDDPEKCELS